MSIDLWIKKRISISPEERIFQAREIIAFYRRHVFKTLLVMAGLSIVPFVLIGSIPASIVVTMFIVLFITMLGIVALPTKGIFASYTRALLQRGPWIIIRPIIVPHESLTTKESATICDGINPNNVVQISNHVHFFKTENDAILFKLGIGRVPSGANVDV